MHTNETEAMTLSEAANSADLQTTEPQPNNTTDKSNRSDGKFLKAVKKLLRVLAIITSALLSMVLLLLLTLGILLGTLSSQFSEEAVNNVIYETDFNAVLSAIGAQDKLAGIYSGAVSAISSESTDYYDTLEEFLDSREFKNFVASSLNRIMGAMGDDGFSVSFRSDDVMMLAGFLTGPIEQYFGYALTDNDMELIASILDILGIGGKLLTIPLGEFVGIVYAIRFILTDTLRHTVFFACAVAVLLIVLLNRKHLLTGTMMCAVPLTLACITWASFSFTTTLILMLLKVKISALATPVLIYTAPARDYMATVSLIYLVAAVAITLFPKALAWGKKTFGRTAA